MNKDDGGPAFPCPVGHIECKHPEGMSLRDYFAAAALQGLLASNNYSMQAYIAEVASDAYSQADAMLEVRKK